MRKLFFLMFFVLASGVIWLLFFAPHKQTVVNPKQDTLSEERYVVGRLNETIDKLEAEKVPPKERWHEIKDLRETVAIDLICHSSSSKITDQNTVKEIVDLLQESRYIEKTEYPKNEPNLKLYFRKKDGFIMAGRFYVKEGVIISPEGPEIKVDQMAVQKLMENADCNK